MDSPYDVLGLDADADEAAVERAYRRRVKESHPDRGGSAAEFQRVRRAYEALVSGEELPRSDAGSTTSTKSGRRDPTSGDTRSRRPGDHHAGSDSEPDSGTQTPRTARIEYLDYEVVADHGWSIDDSDLFEKAAGADLDPDEYGQFLAQPGETLLEAAENRGFAWPYACRGGACANCAVAVIDGELDASVDNILSDDMIDRGFRLSCIGRPITDDMQVVFNVKHLPGLDELRLPADRFERARADD